MTLKLVIAFLRKTILFLNLTFFFSPILEKIQESKRGTLNPEIQCTLFHFSKVFKITRKEKSYCKEKNCFPETWDYKIQCFFSQN